MIQFQYVLEQEVEGPWDAEYRMIRQGKIDLPFRPLPKDRIEVLEGWAWVRGGVEFAVDQEPLLTLVLDKSSS